MKLRSCERPKARRGRAKRGDGGVGGGCRGRILDVFDRRATQGRDANARFHDGSQTVRCSRCLDHQVNTGFRPALLTEPYVPNLGIRLFVLCFLTVPCSNPGGGLQVEAVGLRAQDALGDGAVVGVEHDAHGLTLAGGTRGRLASGGGGQKLGRQRVLLGHRLVADDGDFAIAGSGDEGDDAVALEEAEDALAAAADSRFPPAAADPIPGLAAATSLGVS